MWAVFDTRDADRCKVDWFDWKEYQKHKARNEDIRAQHMTGVTLAAIGAHYGLSRERIRQICASHCQPGPKGPAPNNPVSPLCQTFLKNASAGATPSQQRCIARNAEIVRLHRGGARFEDIAAGLGIDRSTAFRAWKREQASEIIPTMVEAITPSQRRMNKLHAEIVNRRLDGEPFADIADALCVDVTTARRVWKSESTKHFAAGDHIFL